MSQLSTRPPVILERTLGMPAEGAKCIPITLDFSTVAVDPATGLRTFALDYSNMQQRGFLSMLQTIWVDNSLSGDVFLINVPATNQVIKIPANVQDYFTVIVPNPIKIQFQSAGASVVTVLLLNCPVQPQNRG